MIKNHLLFNVAHVYHFIIIFKFYLCFLCEQWLKLGMRLGNMCLLILAILILWYYYNKWKLSGVDRQAFLPFTSRQTQSAAGSSSMFTVKPWQWYQSSHLSLRNNAEKKSLFLKTSDDVFYRVQPHVNGSLFMRPVFPFVTCRTNFHVPLSLLPWVITFLSRGFTVFQGWSTSWAPTFGISRQSRNARSAWQAQSCKIRIHFESDS